MLSNEVLTTHLHMLTQLTATPIFRKLAYGEFYCKGLYIIYLMNSYKPKESYRPNKFP